MRKEVGYAIIAGILLGLIVAYGVFRINSEVGKNKNKTVVLTPSPTPSPIENKDFKVILDKPNQNDVITVDSTNLSGLTKKSSWVLINGENSDYLTKSNESGGFSTEVDLISGVNQFKITAYDETGRESTSNLTVVYSSSFALPDASASADLNATGEAALKQKVAAGINNVLNSPKAYIGTVTDATDKTLEIKTKQNEIQQISITTEGTAVVNATTATIKNVKTADIAIGDFIVAMGYVQNNSVLNSTRVLIIQPLSEPKITNYFGKIASTNRKGFDLTTIPEGKEVNVLTDTKTDFSAFKENIISSIKLTSLEEGEFVILSLAEDAKGNPVARSIFQLSTTE
jgi:hypothetical protein